MQQQGGSQYGVPPPELNPPFFTGGAGQRQQRVVGIHGGVEHLQQPVAEAASPISSRSAPPISIFDDFGGGGVVARGIADEEALGAGEEGERGGSGGGNRWPRQETLVLLKVRSEMDAAFRDATLKGPLWEDVSRKLSEMGYARSAKKCKEKFENVHKYYKRTKEGRAGRQDGKSYRFFSQLEALHSTTATAAASSAAAAAVCSFSSAFNTNFVPSITTEPALLGCAPMAAPPAPRIDPPPPPASEMAALPPSQSAAPEAVPMVGVGGISFSSNTSSSSSSDSDGGEDTDDGALPDGNRKRKREGWLDGSGKTMAFFERLMKTLMERQEAMQQRFLDTIEKREQDRMIREEAWKRQEMARLNREYELMAQERTMAANRDAAVISFLQKFTGTIKNTPPPPPPPPTNTTIVSALPSPEPSPDSPPPLAAENQKGHQGNEIVLHQPLQSTEPNASAVAELPETADMVSPSSLSSSRWPKAEVLALIRLRSGLETRYMDAGPKGPLWEEISMGMKRLGYNRSTKRCKEKWENINKYFKKVKEGNKKRPEDAKTCPYYHELDALYRRKQQQEITTTIPAPSVSGAAEQETNSVAAGNKIPAVARTNAGNGVNHEVGGGGSAAQMPRSNGIGLSQVFFGGTLNSGGGGGGGALKKPEDILKELMEQQHRGEEDEYDDDDEEEDDDDEDGKLQYEVQFQRQNVGSAGGARSGAGNATDNAPAPSASNAGSFLAMVQ